MARVSEVPTLNEVIAYFEQVNSDPRIVQKSLHFIRCPIDKGNASEKYTESKDENDVSPRRRRGRGGRLFFQGIGERPILRRAPFKKKFPEPSAIFISSQLLERLLIWRRLSPKSKKV
jgi:hypothetical protein